MIISSTESALTAETTHPRKSEERSEQNAQDIRAIHDVHSTEEQSFSGKEEDHQRGQPVDDDHCDDSELDNGRPTDTEVNVLRASSACRKDGSGGDDEPGHNDRNCRRLCRCTRTARGSSNF